MEGKQFRALVMSACQMCVRGQDRLREEGAEAGGIKKNQSEIHVELCGSWWICAVEY